MSRPKVLSTIVTKYPLDYDKNNKSGYEEWRRHIRSQLDPNELPLLEAKRILIAENLFYLAILYYKQLAKEPKPKYENGDYIIYIMMFLAAIVIGLIASFR